MDGRWHRLREWAWYTVPYLGRSPTIVARQNEGTQGLKNAVVYGCSSCGVSHSVIRHTHHQTPLFQKPCQSAF